MEGPEPLFLFHHPTFDPPRSGSYTPRSRSPEVSMRRRALLRALPLLVLATLAASSTDAAPSRLDARLPDGFWEQARGLFPTRPKQSQLDALQFRKAPAQLDVLVVGVDFSDSLMWGRDLADFPDHPEQRRTGTRSARSICFATRWCPRLNNR